MSGRLRRVGLVGALLTVAALGGSPAAEQEWSAATPEELAKGTLEKIELDGSGRLRLAPRFETLWGPAEGVVWDVAPDGDGGVFVALSTPGRLIHVDAEGNSEGWYESGDEDLVTSVAVAPDGEVVIGVSPGGRLLGARRPGQWTERAVVASSFVWDLAHDRRGRLWVAGGQPGQLLRLRGDGTPEVLFAPGDDDVRRLTMRADGTFVVGTARKGLVLHFDREDRPFVLFDADEAEVVDLAEGPAGVLYALTVGSPPSKPQTGARPKPTFEEQVTVTAKAPAETTKTDDKGASPAKAAKAEAPSRPGGSLYRLDPEGGVWPLWRAADATPYGVVIDGDGAPVVATGRRGRIVTLGPHGEIARQLAFPSSAASALVRDEEGRLWIGGSSDARLAVLGPDRYPSGSYLSVPIDAGSVARWGRLRLERDAAAAGRLSLRVRVGNTAEPDATWSDWADVAGSGGTYLPDVPATRWIQIGVDFRSGASRLSGISLRFNPANRPPVIRSLDVEPPGLTWVKLPQQSNGGRGPVIVDDPVARRAAQAARPASRSAPIRRTYEQGVRTVRWDATDPDEDRLSFTLELGVEGEGSWHPLALELTDRFHSFDTRSIPDGRYRVRLTATDAPDRPADESRDDRRVSRPFTVDHRAPQIEGWSVRRRGDRYEIGFAAVDRGGQLIAAEWFDLDRGRWRPLAAEDGVSDSERERYRISVPASVGFLRVRVTDAAGNVGGEMKALDAR